MIVVPEDLIHAASRDDGVKPARILARDGEGVYSLLGVSPYVPTVAGVVYSSPDALRALVQSPGWEREHVRIKVRVKGGRLKVRGFVRQGKRWSRDDVMVVPAHGQLFSRFKGLLETEVLSGKKVLIVGQGSGGAPITIGLVQSGVVDLTLIDHDRLEVGNIMRHVLGLADVGRYKTKAMADFVRQKNPDARVRTLEVKIGWDCFDLVKREVERADLVFCAVDNREAKRVINKACVEAGKTLIIGSAFRRAYAGQVLRVRPGRSLCYECFLKRLPEDVYDQEISNREQAQAIAYADRPVPIEPGLASDIQPVSLLMVKLGIQELLADSPTTLRCLDDDLVAPLYRWVNRREKDTACEKWEPLEFNIDGFHVLRWYGMAIPADPGCVICGDYVGEECRRAGVTLSEDDIAFFGQGNGD
jgi:molybdopterin/thiamine biosynthesis adenylyltransferase